MPLNSTDLFLIYSSIIRFDGVLRSLAIADGAPPPVIDQYELVCSAAAAYSTLVYEVPADAPPHDGEPLSLVVLKNHVLLIRNGVPWVLSQCAPSQLANIESPEIVFIESTQGKPFRSGTIIATGKIVRPVFN